MKKAYTLVEMLIVVAVLSALAAFIIPTYQLLLSQFQLTSSASEISGYIRLTEQKTVTEQKIYGVTMHPNSTVITQFLYNTDSETKSTQEVYTLPSNIIISSVNFSGSSDVRFAPSGAPSVSGSLVIKDVVRNRSRRIEIRPSGAILTNTGEY